MQRPIALLTCLAAITFAVSLDAQEPTTAPSELVDLGPRLEVALKVHPLPALAAAIFDSEQLLGVGVSGVRKAGTEPVALVGDLWHIGSITKSFTSTMIGVLVERGDLRWDMRLAELMPGQVEGTPFADVTLEMLGSHRSGLPANLTPAAAAKLQNGGGSMVEQRRGAAAELLRSEAVHEPGTAFLYSNGGYITLGSVLESVSGEPWEELARELVLGPLGLSSAGFGAPGTAGQLDQPLGHRRRQDGTFLGINPGPWADNPPLLGPAGTLHMTIADLARFGREHLRGETGKQAMLSSETFQRLHRAIGDNYALGWVDVNRDWQGERRVVWHNGSNTFWYAFLALVPGSDFGVAVATNGSIAGREAVEELAAELFAEFDNEDRPVSAQGDPGRDE